MITRGRRVRKNVFARAANTTIWMKSAKRRGIIRFLKCSAIFRSAIISRKTRFVSRGIFSLMNWDLRKIVFGFHISAATRKFRQTKKRVICGLKWARQPNEFCLSDAKIISGRWATPDRADRVRKSIIIWATNPTTPEMNHPKYDQRRRRHDDGNLESRLYAV